MPLVIMTVPTPARSRSDCRVACLSSPISVHTGQPGYWPEGGPGRSTCRAGRICAVLARARTSLYRRHRCCGQSLRRCGHPRSNHVEFPRQMICIITIGRLPALLHYDEGRPRHAPNWGGRPLTRRENRNKPGIRRPATWLLGRQVDQLRWADAHATVPPRGIAARLHPAR